MSAYIVSAAIAAGSLIGAALTYLVYRFTRGTVETAVRLSGSSPPCDRCGNDTGKPWLWRTMHARWYCADCDRWLNGQLFPDTSAPDYNREFHMAFLDAYTEQTKRLAAADPLPRPLPEHCRPGRCLGLGCCSRECSQGRCPSIPEEFRKATP